MIIPGDIAPRQDSAREIFVAVLSNDIHLSADTGRVIVCPFIPGQVPADAVAMVVPVEQPVGTLLPELVQWLPTAALADPIGNVGAAAVRQTTAIISALLT